MTRHWSKLTPTQKVSAVREGLADGLTHAQIAANYEGCTRNASIGVAHRSGQQRPAVLPPVKRVAAPATRLRPVEVVKPPPPAPPVIVGEPASRRVRLVDRAGTCAYLDDGRDAHGYATCCGNEVETGSWCGWHQRLVYRRDT